LVTTAAAANVALPGWLAVTVQVPAATSVMLVPLTVHTLGVVDANVTVKPDDAVADSAGGVVPTVWLLKAAKVMLCAVSGTAATPKVLDTPTAAA
jgi:hypothetical protein